MVLKSNRRDDHEGGDDVQSEPLNGKAKAQEDESVYSFLLQVSDSKAWILFSGQLN
jgi:hypothetical protein